MDIQPMWVARWWWWCRGGVGKGRGAGVGAGVGVGVTGPANLMLRREVSVLSLLVLCSSLPSSSSLLCSRRPFPLCLDAIVMAWWVWWFVGEMVGW